MSDAKPAAPGADTLAEKAKGLKKTETVEKNALPSKEDIAAEKGGK